MEKDFDTWSKIKQKIDKKVIYPYCNERDVFWCSVGINIGDEENGKDDLFSRPVLVFKKFNNNLFWGITMSTKNKENMYYIMVSFHDKNQSVMISHLRLYDVKRLIKRMGKMHHIEYQKVVNGIINLLPKPLV